jgi:hypothetical protein
MSGIAMGARKASARIGAPTPKRSQPTQANLTGGRMRHEEIARVAFYKWDKRGRPIGDDFRDWFEAEAELQSQLFDGAHS